MVTQIKDRLTITYILAPALLVETMAIATSAVVGSEIGITVSHRRAA